MEFSVEYSITKIFDSYSPKLHIEETAASTDDWPEKHDAHYGCI